MIRPNPTYESQTADLNRQFLSQIQSLQRFITAGDELSAIETWLAVRKLIDALPLPTDQYDLAVLRLNNCKRYLTAAENGAAGYELKLLMGTLAIEQPAKESLRTRAKRQLRVVFKPIKESVEETAERL